MEYEFPPHVRVSRECKDLLKHILVPDPASRYTVEDIQRHPWYLKDLPPGVKEMNDNLPPPAPGLQVLHCANGPNILWHLRLPQSTALSPVPPDPVPSTVTIVNMHGASAYHLLVIFHFCGLIACVLTHCFNVHVADGRRHRQDCAAGAASTSGPRRLGPG